MPGLLITKTKYVFQVIITQKLLLPDIPKEFAFGLNAFPFQHEDIAYKN